MNNNNEITNEDLKIMQEIEKKKSSFMDSLLSENEEVLSLEEFENSLTSRNKNGVHKELLNFIGDDINTPIPLNKLLMGLKREGKTLTFKMLEEKGNLKDFKDYLVKTNAKVKKGDFVIKSIIKNNMLYLVKRVRE